jgi:O-acetyl-ADP-ribose deacetylase (regulator of RNase III)
MAMLCLGPAGRPVPVRPEISEIVLDGRVGRADVRLIVHIESVELLTDIDIIVVPANVYLEPPQPFKSSVFAAVRNSAAVKNQDGQVMKDVIAEELLSWLSDHGGPGLPVTPGMVVPTSPGELKIQGIRRLYHVAVTSPLPGTNDYYVEPRAISTGVRNALEIARSERLCYDPPLRSVGFPLLGAGRGGLTPATSFTRLWSALAADIKANGPWEIHFITRHQPHADLIVGKLRQEGVVHGPAG